MIRLLFDWYCIVDRQVFHRLTVFYWNTLVDLNKTIPCPVFAGHVSGWNVKGNKCQFFDFLPV
ncbi:MAG: hypothetical protein COB90_07115 [Hyphomicrobiales bacterium]|nr:MAG: hypothetical protein COB90_07115 [Hyphomicrobiales bacterium]